MGRVDAWDELSLFGIWDELSPNRKLGIATMLLVVNLLSARESPFFDNCAPKKHGLSGLAFQRSTLSNAQNRTFQK